MSLTTHVHKCRQAPGVGRRSLRLRPRGMMGYEKSRCCPENFYCTDSIRSPNKVKGKSRQRNVSSSGIFDLPCDVKLRTLLFGRRPNRVMEVACFDSKLQ